MTVIRPSFDAVRRRFETISDGEFEAAWERPVRDAITAIHQAVESGERRVVVVLPSAAAVEESEFGHVAAPVEAIRIAALSAAAAFREHGVTVNVVTTSTLDAEPDGELLEFLTSDAAAAVTGQTIGSMP